MPDPLLDILGEPENKVSATSPKEVSLDDIFGEPELKKKEPSEVGSEVGGQSMTPVQDLPFAYEESKTGLFDKLAEAIQTPHEKSGFRTVQEKGVGPQISMGKVPAESMVFDKQKEDQQLKEQIELSRLNVKDKYEIIKPELDELKETITKQKQEADAAFNYTKTTLDELKRAGQLDTNAPDVAELVGNYSQLYKQTQENDKALRNIKDAELFVDDLEKVISGKNKRFSEGVSQTFLKKISFDGIAEIKRNFNLKEISDRIANNEDITEDEQMAISAYGLLNEAQYNFPSGIGYDVGRSLVEMVPYLASFAVSGGVSKGIQEGLLQAMRSTGEKTAKEMIKKGVAYVSGQAVRPAFFTSLYSQGFEKQIGQVSTDQEGKPTIVEGTKEKPIKAFTKAYASTLSEVMTEQLGEVAAPIMNRVIGKEVRQALNPSLITKVKDAVAFNGFALELGEEFANKVTSVAIEGQPIEEIFNPREFFVTTLTVGAMGGGFMIANATYKKAVNDKIQETGMGFDTKVKKHIDQIIESNKPIDEKAKELSYIVDEKIKSKASEKEISNIVQYATLRNAEYTASNVEEITPIIEENKADLTEEKAPQTRDRVESELKEKYGNERGSELLSMFDFFTEKYVYTPEEFAKAKKEGKLPTEEVVEPQSQIIRPIKFDKEGDLTDESFDDLTNDLRNTITEVANKYNIPEGSLLKHFHITDKGEYFSGTTPILKAGESIEFNSLFDTVIGVLEDAGYKDVDSIYEYKRELLNALERDETPKVPKKIQEVLSAIQEIGDSFQENIKSKITEEPKDAKGILKTQEQVSPGGDAIKEGEGVSRPDVQQEPEAGAKAGDEGKRLAYAKNEALLDEINTSISKMKEENPNEFKKDGSPKAKSKLLMSFKALNDVRSGVIEEMSSQYQEEFAKRAKEESERSRIETEKINKAFEERQVELKKNIPPEELKEIESENEVQRIFDKASANEVPTQEEINYVNENAYLPKGFEFGEKGLQKVKEKEPVKPEIEPEVAKKLRSVANKIREGKISRIQGFKADTPFTLAWDGGLEVLATTLEATADLTVAIDKALTHIKNTEWYKNLTKDRQVEFDKKFEEHIDKELGDEYRDATKHKFVNKDVEERFNQAVIHPKTFMDKAKEAFTDLRDKILRTYKDLPKNKRFAEAYNAINQFQKGVEISSSKAGDIITRILGKMSKPDYELFTKKIIFDDLLETIKMNPVYELPYGLTEETLKQELDNINKFVAFNAKVKDAIKKRKEVYKEVQSEYVDYANKIGVKTEGYFERNDYFRHQVLLYSEASKGTIERKGSPLSRPKKLSLFKERVQGRGLDINRNYIESEFEVFNKLLYAIEKMKMIDNIYRNYDIMKDLKAKAKEELGEEATRAEINRWVEDNIPDGYVIDSPENMNIFMAQSIPESLVQDLLLGNVEEMGIKRDDLRKIFALGAAKKIVIPTEIYKTMDNISRVNDKDRFAQFSKKLLTGWKIWTLIQPKRFFKYNIRNLTGDSEAVFLGNPRVFKKTLASARELYDVFVSKDTPSPDMNEYISRGGLQLVLTTQEIGELRKVKEFEKYYDNKRNVLSKAWDGYWKTAKLTTDFREQLLRYAAYKEWLSEIDKNNGKVKNYGASNREFIDGLESKYDKAFRLSNELLGAYDQISEAGQNLRSYWIPFWSFQEINFRRTNQMFLNALDSEKSLSGKSLKGIEFAAKKVPFIAWKATKLSIKLSGFWAMTAVWNGLLFGDEEDELPEEIKSKPHIVFGRNPDGTIRYLSRLGVMGDYLEWFGMDSMPMYINEWLAGRMSTSDIAKDMVLSAPNKLVNGVNPYVKTTAELIFRKSLFPDISKPRAIRDFGEQIAINLGLKDEYRAISKLPDKPYYNSLRKMFWDEIDPLATAYWNIASYKSDFKKKQGKDEKGSYSFTDKSLALYYYKQALMYGDTKSAEYHLDRYIMLGGTKRGYNTSMSYLNPMRGIKEEEKDEFIKFLGEENKYLLDQAMKYYDKVLNLKMDWPDDKLEEELDTVEIPL